VQAGKAKPVAAVVTFAYIRRDPFRRSEHPRKPSRRN
jgi:hypothetical protein